jgi:hypothetical protein
MLYSAILLDLLSLMLQNGQIGWYSENSVPHPGQYQATLAIPYGLLAHTSLLDLCSGKGTVMHRFLRTEVFINDDHNFVVGLFLTKRKKLVWI